MMFLKLLSAAVAIGTGAPFGAEGPIIATGGALGQLTQRSRRLQSNRGQDSPKACSWRSPRAEPPQGSVG